MDKKNIILDIYKNTLENERKKTEDEELGNRIYQMLLEDKVLDPHQMDELLYKAGDHGYELGYLEGFKTAIRLMTECLI